MMAPWPISVIEVDAWLPNPSVPWTDRFDRVGVAERCQGVSGCTYGGCAEGQQPFFTIEDFARTERSPIRPLPSLAGHLVFGAILGTTFR